MSKSQQELVPYRARLRLTPAGMVMLPVGIIAMAGLTTWLVGVLLGIQVWAPRGIMESSIVALLALCATLLWTAIPVSMLTVGQVRRLVHQQRQENRAGGALTQALERYRDLQQELEERHGQVLEQRRVVAEALARIEGRPDRQDLYRGYMEQQQRLGRVTEILAQVLRRVWTSRSLLELYHRVESSTRERPILPPGPPAASQLRPLFEQFQSWVQQLQRAMRSLDIPLTPPVSLPDEPTPRQVRDELMRLHQGLGAALEQAERVTDELRFRLDRHQTDAITRGAGSHLSTVPEVAQVMATMEAWQQDESSQRLVPYQHLPLLDMDDLDPQLDTLQHLGVHIEAEVSAALEVLQVTPPTGLP